MAKNENVDPACALPCICCGTLETQLTSLVTEKGVVIWNGDNNQ
jgi:hypothetical protein